jgi:hypothetical protein
MESQQDIFISHAGRDKEQYIQPLTAAFVAKGITFWLDNIEIGWGDSITRKINDGLARSRFVLLCLSRAFLQRRWPEAELGAALSIQNTLVQDRSRLKRLFWPQPAAGWRRAVVRAGESRAGKTRPRG